MHTLESLERSVSEDLYKKQDGLNWASHPLEM